jgi:hypothetical protein
MYEGGCKSLFVQYGRILNHKEMKIKYINAFQREAYVHGQGPCIKVDLIHRQKKIMDDLLKISEQLIAEQEEHRTKFSLFCAGIRDAAWALHVQATKDQIPERIKATSDLYFFIRKWMRENGVNS